MREQLRRAEKPVPKVIGIDEISIRKGHTYILESDGYWTVALDNAEAAVIPAERTRSPARFGLN